MINSQTEIERNTLFSKHRMSVSICRMNLQNIKNVYMVFSRENHKGKANFGLYSLANPTV